MVNNRLDREVTNMKTLWLSKSYKHKKRQDQALIILQKNLLIFRIHAFNLIKMVFIVFTQSANTEKNRI